MNSGANEPASLQPKEQILACPKDPGLVLLTGQTRPAVSVFFVVLVLLAILQGSRFLLTNDEGIMLEPAQRLAAGARPYVDFFGMISPGSYWIQAAWFKVLGITLWAGRLPVIFDFALQCALLFWLTARLASRRAALAAMIIFTGFQISNPTFLTAQHRWDSGMLALAGICLAVRFPSNRGLLGSGAALAAASWCTPSIGLTAAAVALWLLLASERRRFLPAFLAGMAVVTAVAAAALALQGSLAAFLQQMLWLRRNYATVNIMPYGSVIGGYARLIAHTAGLQRVLRIIFVGCLTLPAVLPPLALLLWLMPRVFRKIPAELQPTVLLLLMTMVTLELSAFPRADLFHLAFVAAIPYALVAAGLARLLTARVGAIAAFTFIPLAIVFSLNNILGAWEVTSVASPVGKLHVAPEVAPELSKLLEHVRPGQSLFVYPYMPVLYFVTQANNPTRFSFMHPGMMTADEESKVLADLRTHPPEWLLNMPLSQEEFARVFPNANRTNTHFEKLERWLAENYVPVDQAPVNLNGYQLWHILKKGG